MCAMCADRVQQAVVAGPVRGHHAAAYTHDLGFTGGEVVEPGGLTQRSEVVTDQMLRDRNVVAQQRTRGPQIEPVGVEQCGARIVFAGDQVAQEETGGGSARHSPLAEPGRDPQMAGGGVIPAHERHRVHRGHVVSRPSMAHPV
jgi:hypothetical protein